MDSREFSFADIKINILGADLSGLRGITYKKSQEKELVYGTGSEPKAVQRGNKKYEGALTVLKSDFDLMHIAALAAGYTDLMDVPAKDITATIVYQKDDGSAIQTDVLYNLEFTEAEDGQKQNDKFKEVNLPFIFLRLVKA
jgi:hypothetical protein